MIDTYFTSWQINQILIYDFRMKKSSPHVDRKVANIKNILLNFKDDIIF